jgi:hypothetical protein
LAGTWRATATDSVSIDSVLVTYYGGVYNGAITVPADPSSITILARDSAGNRAADSLVWATGSFDSVHSSANHICGLAAGGAAYCAGSDARGQLGDGPGDATGQAPVPVAGGIVFSVVRVGPSSSCGLDATGAAYCWGRNATGQLGDGTTADRDVPTPVAGGHTFTEIRPAAWTTCALDDSGTPYCWGLTPRITADSAVLDTVPTPRAVAAPAPLVRMWMDPAGHHACGVDSAGAGYCWWGSEGYDDTTGPFSYDTVAVKIGDGPFATLQPVPDLGGWAEALPWTFAVLEDGTLDAFGGDQFIGDVLSNYPSGPFNSVLVVEGSICVVSTSGVPWCGSSLGPSVAYEDAQARGLDVAEYTIAPCFLTSAGSLYCRPTVP